MRIRTNGLFKKKNIYTIERYTFFLLILSMPFTDFLIEFPFISHYLPRLFILLGLGIILFERIQYGIRFSKIEKILLMLMGITFIWYIISNLHGFLFYPFFYPSHWDDFKEILFLKKYFFDFFLENNILATKIAAVFYFIRMSFFECLYTMGAAFFAIHLYQENPKSGFNDFQKYIVILAVIIILYSLIELPALMGSTLCKSILAFINYHTMSINHVGGGWPPVFWPMQVRSIFAEPSFFGLGFAVIFPILLHWSTFYDKEKKWMYLRIVIVVMYVLLAFATRSRTTTVLILAETALFAFGFLWIRVLDFKKLLKIIIPVALAFLLSLPLLSTFSGTWYDRTTQEKSITSMADTYVEDNITSVINTAVYSF
nr:hypothetical protein [uncultured Mitsuokella sp.]